MRFCEPRARAGWVLAKALLLSACQPDNGPCLPKATVVDWKTDGSVGARWNAATQTLAYGRPGPDGHYRVYLSAADGKAERRLTSPLWADNRHQFAAVWHPSGKYLFVEVEKTDHAGSSDDAIPGYGAYTDLWLITRDGAQAWKLFELPDDDDHALTSAAITADGTRLAFTERIKSPNFMAENLMAGSYVFQVADFADFSAGAVPQLGNLRTVQPGNLDQGAAVAGISADGSTLTFYSTYVTKSLQASRVYTMNINTSVITEYSTASFARAPQFTPDEQSLVYSTASQADTFAGEAQGADWWLVSRDQSLRERLTCMNSRNNAQSVNHYRLAGAVSFTSERSFFGDVQTVPLGLVGKIVQVSW